MRSFIAILIVFVLVCVFFPSPAMADCSGGACRLGQVVSAPVRLARAIRNRDRKPVVNGVRWLVRR